MGKVVMFNRVSLDGFFAGPHGEIDWFIRDPEVDKALHEMGQGDQAGQADTLIFGRVTYRLFESVWPKVAADPNAPQDAQATAREVNEMTKVVFSKTLEQVTWPKSRLVKGDPAQEVRKLKQGSDSTLMIFGSGTIVQQLAAEGLIDEYILGVTPVILGAGKPLFEGVKKLGLSLLETRDFKSGNVLLRYRG